MSAAGWREPRVRRLANGLTVGLVEDHRAPLVATALCYRAGATAEPPGQEGAAHFLEHMMFKGSRRYGPGEIDRRTEALGGSNNAYTSHDSTLYYFTFAADRWREALAMEADRMAGLRLDRREVDAERSVILEEVAMVEDDPWEALELRLQAAVFGPHPYGRPVLGTPASLARLGGRQLAAFHRRHYRPDNAVLLVAGDVGEELFAAAAAEFAGVDSGSEPVAGAPPAPPSPSPVRVERRHGDVGRLLVALPAPAPTAPGYAALRLLLTVLAGGRASRLHRQLVDELELCTAVSAELDETVVAGLASIGCELVPGAPLAEVEARVVAALDELAASGPSAAETRRARRLLLADWEFSQESVHQRALAAAAALALFDAGYPGRHLAAIERAGVAELRAAAGRLLRPAGRVAIGLSRPRAGAA